MDSSSEAKKLNGESKSSHSAYQNGSNQLSEEKSNKFLSKDSTSSNEPKPNEKIQQIIEERNRLRQDLQELKEKYQQSSDEVFDLKIKSAELNILLSPYREVYEGHGVYRQWMPYEVDKSKEVLGLEHDVRIEIELENKKREESLRRGRIRQIASRIVLEPEAWKEFEIIEKAKENGFHPKEEKPELLPFNEGEKQQEEQAYSRRDTEEKPRELLEDRDRDRGISEENCQPEKPEEPKSKERSPIEPATSNESIQGSVNEQKPTTSTEYDPIEAYTKAFLNSEEHQKRMEEFRSRLSESDYFLPDCSSAINLNIQLVAEIEFIPILDTFKSAPVRDRRNTKTRRDATDVNSQTIKVKSEEGSPQEDQKEPAKPVVKTHGRKRAAIAMATRSTSSEDSLNGIAAKRGREEPNEGGIKKEIIANSQIASPNTGNMKLRQTRLRSNINN